MSSLVCRDAADSPLNWKTLAAIGFAVELLLIRSTILQIFTSRLAANNQYFPF